MKRLLLSVMLLLAFCMVDARPIQQSEALRLATQFMKKWTKKPVMRMVSITSLPHGARGRSGQEPFYIYNNEKGKGFVIVSGDDAVGTILAYSDKGSFSFKDAPENLRFWMEAYAKRVRAITAHDATEETETDTPQPVVKPLLGEINWGQDKPYNNDGPTWSEDSETHHYYVGCVATATAQIMRYYKWPVHGTGSHTYNASISDINGKETNKKLTLSADFSKDTYEWDKMLPNYSTMTYTAEQAKAVALLNAHVAISVNMDYSPTGSGAYSPMVPYALRTFFGYDKSIRYVKREHCPTSEWIALIKNELNAGRPVYYSATSEDGQGGHAFVCDGYDSRDFVHINWGWHGESNGYFMVNHMNPAKLGIGADKSGFNIEQEIIINIKPAEASTNETYYPISSPTRLSLMLFNDNTTIKKSMSLACYIENYDVDPVKTDVTAVLMKNDEIVKYLKEDKLSLTGYNDGKAGFKYYIMRDIPLDATGVEDGEYKVCFAVRPEGHSQWTILRHPIGYSAYGSVKVEKGMIVRNLEYKPQPKVKLLTKINFDGDLYADGAALVNVRLKNLGKDFSLSKLIFKFTSLDNPQKVFLSDTIAANVYNESTEDLQMVFALPEKLTAGKYKVQLYHEKFDKIMFDDSEVGTTKVEVLPAVTEPLLRQVSEMGWLNAETKGQDPILQGKKIVLACDVRNYGKDGMASVVSYFKNTTTDKEYVFMQETKELEKGAMETMKFYKDLPLEPGTYKVGTKYLSQSGLVDIASSYEPATVVVEKNPDTKLECTAFDFPTELVLGETATGSYSVKALKDLKNALVKVALRTFTGRGGELITLTRLTAKANDVANGKLTYTPKEGKIAPGLYLMQLTCKEGFGKGSVDEAASGYDNYYRIVRIVNSTNGIKTVDNNALVAGVKIWAEANKLRLQPESESINVREVSIYTTSGLLLKRTVGEVNEVEMPKVAGNYILKVVTNKGIVVKKFLVD